jgi:hypothetical protein
MSFDHKAFEFRWEDFALQLLPLLSHALERNETAGLRDFISRNMSFCRNPYSGALLSHDWESRLEVGDVQELGDFALTKYYSPIDDHGLGTEWQAIERQLSDAHKAALLGSAVPLFDPGRQGSYFQSTLQVVSSAQLLSALVDPRIRSFQIFLAQVARAGHGVYVTF